MNPAAKVASVLAASAVAVPLIAQWEGLELVSYRDVVGIPTVCYGSTGNVIMGKEYSERECLERLAKDVVDHGVKIVHCISVPVKPEPMAAFISFAFNVGSTAFCESTLARKLNTDDLAGACAQLDRWINAGGKPVQGLVNRRKAERAMCERGLP